MTDQKQLSLQDLRAIIHGLRMMDLSFVDADAIDEIKAMIQVLPSPESLAQLSKNPLSIKQVQKDIGGIMRLIELYSKKDGEYKSRYKARTGLPPRYKVLEWREAMSKSEIRNSLIRNIIQLSKDVDDAGYSKFSSNLIVCAKKLNNHQLPVEELYVATCDFLNKACVDPSLKKIAQGLPALRDPSLKGVRDGLEQIQQSFAQIQKAFTDKLQYLNQSPQTQKFVQNLGGIWKSLTQLEQYTVQQIENLQKPMADIENEMEQTLIPKSIMFNGKNFTVQWEQDPSDPDTELAFIEVGGQKYEIASDSNGKLVVRPMEINVTPATGTAPETAVTAPATGVTPETSAHGVAPASGNESVSQGQQRRLEDLSRQELVGMLQKYVPTVPLRQGTKYLNDKEIIDVLKKNVGQSVFQNLGVAADKKVFNLKKFSAKIK